MIIFGVAVATLLGGWISFRHYKITPPPIGVINLWDVAFALSIIVGGTFLNLLLPGRLIALHALSLLDSMASCCW